MEPFIEPVALEEIAAQEPERLAYVNAEVDRFRPLTIKYETAVAEDQPRSAEELLPTQTKQREQISQFFLFFHPSR